MKNLFVFFYFIVIVLSHNAYCAENNQRLLYDLINIGCFFACNPDAPFQPSSLDKAKSREPSPETLRAHEHEKNNNYSLESQLVAHEIYLQEAENNDPFAQHA